MQSGDGNRPNAALVADQLGNLYGTTQDGVSNGGIVFELARTGSGFRESRIYAFATGSSQCLTGCGPSGGLISDSKGNLYGVTRYGGNDGCAGGFGCGVAYRLASHGSGFVQTVLYVFQGGMDGASPSGELVIDKSGTLYGTTELGGGSGCGGSGCGTAYALVPSGKKYQETVIHRFGS